MEDIGRKLCMDSYISQLFFTASVTEEVFAMAPFGMTKKECPQRSQNEKGRNCE
jgi:hypothetical protein